MPWDDWPDDAQAEVARRTLEHWKTLRAISPGCGGDIDAVAPWVREEAQHVREALEAEIGALKAEIVKLRGERPNE